MYTLLVFTVTLSNTVRTTFRTTFKATYSSAVHSYESTIQTAKHTGTPCTTTTTTTTTVQQVLLYHCCCNLFSSSFPSLQSFGPLTTAIYCTDRPILSHSVPSNTHRYTYNFSSIFPFVLNVVQHN